MAVDKLVDSTQLDADLTDVADEIRTAGGTLLPLSFPDDYVVAIGDIGNTEIKTVSGSIAHFEDALARKAQDLTVAIEPVQSGSGDPSPDNVRPISGWTGANVTRTGKNLLNQLSDGISTVGGITFAKDGRGGVSISGTATTTYPQAPLQDQLIGTNKAIVPMGATVTLSVISDNVPSGGRVYAIWYERKGANITTNEYTHSTSGTGKVTFTTVEPYTNLIIVAEGNGVTYTNTKAYVQLEYGDAATAFEPSNADTYTIDLDGTRYGGTLDVTTGKLTVDRAMVDLGTLSFYKSSSPSASGGSIFSIPVASVGAGMASREKYAQNTMLCSSYATATDGIWYASDLPDMSMMVNTNRLFVADSRYSDATAFITAISGVQLCYELATPIVYDLDPVTVTTLLGTNNVWADTGDSTIKYIAPKAQIPSAQGVYF